MADINVPNVPGVPPLSSYSANDIVLLLEDVVSQIFGAATPQWGIFLDGDPVLTYDNQIKFSYDQDWDVSSYPVEQGSFTNYNKVQKPSNIRCTFSAGASATNRQEMLQSVDAVMSDTNLYDVVTPEWTYLGYNFTHRDYDREAASVGLVVINIYLEEIIETSTAQFQDTQNPTDAGQVSGGNVAAPQTDPVTQSGVSSGFSDFSPDTFMFGGTT